MSRKVPKYPVDEPADVIDYIQNGYHAFIGCDDGNRRESFVESLQVALDGEIQKCIACGDVSDCSDFAAQLVAACQDFASALGQPVLQRRLNIASSLEEVMDLYGKRERQGFLILNNMDKVIETQRTMEVEGSLRSVMQIYDNIAVAIVASNDTTNGLVGDYDRPFYMSFRVFRL